MDKIKLDHFNPLKHKHSCPSTNEDENDLYHFGDLGNIIANNEGKAFLSIIKNNSLKSLNGRLIIITNAPDKCKENNNYDKLADVIAIGTLNVFKPSVIEKTNGSEEFFLREINSVNKLDFEKKNILNDNRNIIKKTDIFDNNKNNSNKKSESINKIKDDKIFKQNIINLKKDENKLYNEKSLFPTYDNINNNKKRDICKIFYKILIY